jgi:hypothetical protein
MRSLTGVAILLFTICLNQTALAAGDQWYKNWKWVNADPYAFVYNQRDTLFPNSGYQLKGLPVEGYVYAIVTTDYRDDVWKQPNHAKVEREYPLRKVSDVTKFADYFRTRSQAIEVPYYLGALGLIPTPVTQLAANGTTLLDVLLHLVDSPKLRSNAGDLAATMAIGGVFQEIAIITQDADGHDFFNLNIVYQVRIGDEMRSTVVSSATYALCVEQFSYPPNAPRNLRIVP